MQDFGEYVTDGMRFHDGTPPETEHNRYPVRYHRTTRDAVDAMARERPGFEPFFYVRAGFTGAQAATPSVFPGDETTDWSQGSGLPSVVPAMLNLALDGAYAFTTDVGGYFDLTTPRTSPELMTRWAQLAAFTPISRIHDSTFNKSVYPWELGEQTLDAYRRYAKAKVKLIRSSTAGRAARRRTARSAPCGRCCSTTRRPRRARSTTSGCSARPARRADPRAGRDEQVGLPARRRRVGARDRRAGRLADADRRRPPGRHPHHRAGAARRHPALPAPAAAAASRRRAVRVAPALRDPRARPAARRPDPPRDRRRRRAPRPRPPGPGPPQPGAPARWTCAAGRAAGCSCARRSSSAAAA
jgi:hypothetical protein